jgi:hypothetical protein
VMLATEFHLVPSLKNEWNSTSTRLIRLTGVGMEDVTFNSYPVYIDALKGLGFQRKILGSCDLSHACYRSLPSHPAQKFLK